MHTADEEADSIAAKAQGDLKTLSLPAGALGDRAHQSDSAGLGELLCIRTLKSVLLVYPAMGGEENPATPDESPRAPGLRLEAVE